jgi:hypothetical protein
LYRHWDPFRELHQEELVAPPPGWRWSIWLGRNGCHSRTVSGGGNNLRAGLLVSVAAPMVRGARPVGRIEEGDNLWHQHV